MLFLSARPTAAVCRSPEGGDPGRRVGLALSGGGARAIAHIGVLEAFEEGGVRFDCIAGTSMGAAIGALYASGYPAAELERIVESIDWREVFSRRRERSLVPLSRRLDDVPAVFRAGIEGGHLRLPSATGSDYRLDRLLFRLLAGPGLRAGNDFDRLPVPFRAVTTDLGDGERVVLSGGSLPQAVRASLSTPASLPPVPAKDRLLVDGGLVDNLPVDVAREMGAGLVIAVDATSPPFLPEQYRDAIGVGLQVVDVLARARNRASAQRADFVIQPELGRRSSTDYSDVAGAVAAGREAGRAALAHIRALTAPRGAPPGGPVSGPEGTVAEVEVRGTSHVRPRLVRAAFGVSAPRPFSMAEALAGLDRVYATGLFESCWLEAEPAERGLRLAVTVREAPRRTAELGLGYDEADGARGFVRLRDRDLFGWGQQATVAGLASEGEAGIRADLLGDRLWRRELGYWLEAKSIDERPLRFTDGESLGRAEFDRDDLTLGLQAGPGPSALARLGLTLGQARVQSRPGLGLDSARDDVRRLAAMLAWDDLDDRDLPSSGARLRFDGERSLRSLGATRHYWRMQARGQAVLPVARRLLVQGRLLVGLAGGDVPAYDLFRIGGPALLPGLHRDELWGRQALGLSLAPTLLVNGFRLCLRGGAGEVWAARRDITLRSLKRGAGIGLEKATRFGPLALDVGVGESGRTALYLSAGFR